MMRISAILARRFMKAGPNWFERRGSVFRGLLGSWLFRFAYGAVGGLRLIDHLTVAMFPNAEQQEGNDGRGSPQLCVARNFGLRLPAEQLRGYEERQGGPKSQS